MNNEAWVPPFACGDETRRHQITLYFDVDDLRAAADGDLREFLAGYILKFANISDEDTALRVRLLYRICLDAGMPLQHRRDVFNFITGAVHNMSTIDVGAYMPFMTEEPDREIVSAAAFGYANWGSLLDNDPMGRPKEIVLLIEAGESANAGAVFGGLLCLGDAHVCRLLWPIKDNLTLEEAREAANCFYQSMSAATIDFVLGWLESLEGSAQDVLFGGLVSNLLLHKRHMATPMVRTGPRPLPRLSVTDEEARDMAQRISFEEYRRRIAPRLLALEQAEPPPKSMSIVIHEWGIAERDLSGILPAPQ